jgi:hypothetical protein
LWWLKVTTFAEIGDWVELEKLSKAKKSPIGYEVKRRFTGKCESHVVI